MSDSRIADISVIEGLQRQANEAMGYYEQKPMTPMSVFTDNGSSSVQPLQRKADGTEKAAISEEIAVVQKKLLDRVDVLRSKAENRENQGLIRKLLKQYRTIERFKTEGANIEDCYTYSPNLWYGHKEQALTLLD